MFAVNVCKNEPQFDEHRQIDLALPNMLLRLQIRVDTNEIRTFQELELIAVRKEKTLHIARDYRAPPSADESLLPDLACRDPRPMRRAGPGEKLMLAHLQYDNSQNTDSQFNNDLCLLIWVEYRAVKVSISSQNHIPGG